MLPVGQVQLTFTYKNQKHNIQFQVVDGNVPAILGRTTCEKLGMVWRIYEIKTKEDILKDFDDLFSGLGCLQHHIKTDPNVSPVIHPPREVPVALKDKIVEELHKIVEELHKHAKCKDILCPGR